LLGRIFAERHRTGRLDLEAVEMATRSRLHQAGAAVLTALLQSSPSAPRTVPCVCGETARYRELRSKQILTVLGLGVGHQIQVKTAAGREYHKNVQAIESDLFTLLPDHQTASVQIAYSEIANLGPNMSRGSKITLAVVVVAAVLVLALTVGHLGRED
jgi:hypothetical protein